MKLKYYLRGLGLGVLVTAMILMYGMKDGKPMTDDEIRARARELGMSDNTVVAELEENSEVKAAEEKNAEEESEQPQPTETVTEAIEREQELKTETETESHVETTVTKETPEEEASQTKEIEQDGIEIRINGGDSSETVSRRLEDAGLVSSAKTYNTFLCANGYDKKLTVGNHTIPAGATDADIAKILTSKAK